MLSTFSSITTFENRKSIKVDRSGRAAVQVETRDALFTFLASQEGSSSPRSDQGQGRGSGPYLISRVGGFFDSVPRLSNQQDEDQVKGILGLSNALFALAASSSDSSQTTDGSSPSPGEGLPPPLPSLPLPHIVPPGAIEGMRQAATGLEWLAREMMTLTREEQMVGLRIPMEIAAKLASRVTARGVRSSLRPTGPEG